MTVSRPTCSVCTRLGAALLAVLAVGLAAPPEAEAQRPFRVYDPFYRSETARRAFFDGYAVTGEVAYRQSSSATVQDNRQLGLSLRFDYQLLSQVDLSAIVDAMVDDSNPSFGGTTRSLQLSWLVLKYYRTVDNTDYAFRFAVDPAFDGRLGFPQMDLAFIYTSLLSPMLSSDYAFGVRRVRMGFEQFVPADLTATPASPDRPLANDIILSRALGWEAHFMMQYSFLLNPARSNVFAALMVDRGQYDLFETSIRDQQAAVSPKRASHAALSGIDVDADDDFTSRYRGGAIWVRAGFEYNRPGYQLLPFVTIPLKEWVPEGELGQSDVARVSAGVRLMLR